MKYRKNTEALDDKICLTDGGLETVLIFDQGIDLPEFASFTLFDRDDGEQILHDYLQPYIDLAIKHKMAFQLVDSGWRASSGWGKKLGLNGDQLEQVLRRSGELLVRIREQNETADSPMPIIGCIGPQGDGYTPGKKMSAEQAMSYHQPQIKILADTEADAVTAMTLNYAEEGIGIINAAKHQQMPVTISFTVETDGRLPGGESFSEVIDQCDSETDGYATGYMINCAHPTHFQGMLAEGGQWLSRVRGVRANASRMSHEELDNAEKLDRGNPELLGSELADILKMVPSIRVVGGCCGTDIEHLSAIAASCS